MTGHLFIFPIVFVYLYEGKLLTENNDNNYLYIGKYFRAFRCKSLLNKNELCKLNKSNTHKLTNIISIMIKTNVYTDNKYLRFTIYAWNVISILRNILLILYRALMANVRRINN